MHAIQLAESDKPTRGSQPPASSDAPPSGKDKWDKVEIILKPVGGLITAITIAVIGFLGSNYFEKQQATETNLRLYTELMNKREEAENTLRTDMFGKIFATFLTPGAEADSTEDRIQKLNDEIVSIELIARNFHEFLDLKPLFLDTLLDSVRMERRLRSAGSDVMHDPRKVDKLGRQLEAKREHLIGIARRIKDKQLEVLEEAGQAVTLRIPFERVCTDKNVRTYRSGDFCDRPGVQRIARLSLPSLESKTRDAVPEREFTLYVERAYPRWRMARVKVTAIAQGADPRIQPDVDTKAFWVGVFDFPMVDNTYLSPDERYTIVVDEIDDEAMVIKLVYFPSSFAGLREKSYYHQKVVQQLIDGSELFDTARRK